MEVTLIIKSSGIRNILINLQYLFLILHPQIMQYATSYCFESYRSDLFSDVKLNQLNSFMI